MSLELQTHAELKRNAQVAPSEIIIYEWGAGFYIPLWNFKA